MRLEISWSYHPEPGSRNMVYATKIVRVAADTTKEQAQAIVDEVVGKDPLSVMWRCGTYANG